MWSQTYLQQALKLVEPERILFSAAFPYQYRPGRQARTFITQSGLSLSDQKLFAHGNWERLTKLSV